jgi:DNA-binding NarL/FixJ family response regulator
MTMNDQHLLQEISRKLSILISLQLQKDGGEGVQEYVGRLSRFGLGTKEIAEILNTTPGTVAVAKARIKRRK